MGKCDFYIGLEGFFIMCFAAIIIICPTIMHGIGISTTTNSSTTTSAILEVGTEMISIFGEKREKQNNTKTRHHRYKFVGHK